MLGQNIYHSRKNMNEIWVFRPGALGDTILTFPFLNILQNKFESNKIVFWGSSAYASIVQDFFPRIEFRSFDSRQLMPIFSCDFSKTEISINLPSKIFVILKKDKLLEKNLKMICSEISFCEINEINNMWVPDQVCSMLREKSSRDFSFIRPTPENSKILIHMGTGSPEKLLPIEFWQFLIEELKNRFSLTLLFGPAEKNIMAKEFEGIDSISNVSLKDLMEKMKEFRYYIGLDSGVSHLAGVMGLQGIALFHHTNPEYWRPIGQVKDFIINKKDDQTWIAALNFLEAILAS